VKIAGNVLEVSNGRILLKAIGTIELVTMVEGI
jgi:hypothetical protein